MKKKILAMLLAACVSAGSIPLSVRADELSQSGTETTSEVTIAGSTYHWINGETADETELAGLTRIGETNVYYQSDDEIDLSEAVYYGTATLSYTDYYAKDTSIAEYDAISSATTKKNNTFPNEDSTTPTEDGYQILGVKNVPVAVAANIYVEAKLLEAAGELPESGVYAKAAAITLNEAATTAVSQYKSLGEDGTYEATTLNVKDTVSDAAITLKTTSVWGDYELDVMETSTSHIRNSREDSFDINSQIQGIILEATDGTKIGMRHMEEIWVQPYEIAFNLNSVAAENLIKKTVNKVTFLMPGEAYVYEFGDNGAYIKPQASEGSSVEAEFAQDGKTVAVDISKLPADIENPKVTVYYKQGRNTTYYVENAEIVNGVVTLEKTALPNLAYTVIVSSDNYADKAVTSDVLMAAATVGEAAYYWVDTKNIQNAESLTYVAGEDKKALSELTQIGDSSVYYLPQTGLSDSIYYGTATLSYTDYYAKDTSVAEYDAISSATTKKNNTFPNEDSTTPTEDGYQILGVKNVPVAVAANIYVEAKLLEAAGELPESGVYAKAAAITLNEAATTAVSQYKSLGEDGTYEATTLNVKDTVSDAAITLKTTSVWGDYELDVMETSTSHIRNSREDSFDINSQIQGIILEATDGTKIGMRHMEEIWVQPYEIAFNLNSVAAENLIKKTVNKVTFLMPGEAYVYEFGDNGAYIKPQASEGSSVEAEFAQDGKTVAVDISKLPADIENPKVTVYYKQGRNTTYYVENAEIVNGVVTLEKTALPNLTYTVIVSSDNYADKAVSAASKLGDITKADVVLAQSSYTYDGTEKKPAVTVTGLTEGTDYTVTYKNNINAGEAEAVITGKGNYAGAQTVKFKIAAKAITAADVSAIGAVTYNGAAQKPAVTVAGLKADTDYTVAYSNNTNAGTAVATITGKGNYTGTVTKSFTINKKAAAIKVTVSKVTKTVGAKAFSLGAKTDSNGKLTYSTSNKKVAAVSSTGKVTLKKNAVGKAVITITAQETANYKKATKKVTIIVNPQTVSGLKAVSTAKKKMKVSWKKNSNATVYEIQYSTNKNFKSAKKVTVKSAKTTSKVISKLSSKKKYYVRIRTYKMVSKEKYYSSWSKAKTVTVR